MTPKRLLLAAATAALGATVASCTRLSVKSDPPGAAIVWSPDGREPFRPWPPRAWDPESTDTLALLTPYSEWGGYQDAVFITVEKEGYIRPLPQLAQLYVFRSEDLEFQLQERPESFRERMAKDGRILYQGRWVRPQEEGLVVLDGVALPAAEAQRRANLAKGLVEYNGAWMTPEQREERYAADRRAEGLVLFKERWITPQAAALEQEADSAARQIEESNQYFDLDPPRVLGRLDDERLAQIQIFNNSGATVRYLLSGPSSRIVELPPYSSWGLDANQQLYLLPGRYAVGVLPQDSGAEQAPPSSAATRSSASGEARDLQAAFTSQPLVGGYRYSFTYSGARRDLLENLQEYAPPPVQLPVEPRDIPVPETPKEPGDIETGATLSYAGDGALEAGTTGTIATRRLRP